MSKRSGDDTDPPSTLAGPVHRHGTSMRRPATRQRGRHEEWSSGRTGAVVQRNRLEAVAVATSASTRRAARKTRRPGDDHGVPAVCVFDRQKCERPRTPTWRPDAVHQRGGRWPDGADRSGRSPSQSRNRGDRDWDGREAGRATITNWPGAAAEGRRAIRGRVTPPQRRRVLASPP